VSATDWSERTPLFFPSDYPQLGLLAVALLQSFGAGQGHGTMGASLMSWGAAVVQGQAFKGRQFAAEVILWAVRWYLMFPVSYRDLALILLPALGQAGRGGSQTLLP
jgi:hypothetical protein